MPRGRTSRRSSTLTSARRSVIEFARATTERDEYFPQYENLHSHSLRIVHEERQASLDFADAIIDANGPYPGFRLVYFTDGSIHCRGRIGGAGITYRYFPSMVDGWRDVRQAIGGISESNDAEFVAIDSALQLALEEVNRGYGGAIIKAEKVNRAMLPHVYILTDSAMLLHTLGDFLGRKLLARTEDPLKFQHPSFANMLHNLNCLITRGVKLELRWVKAHEGSTGNERADALARMAMKWFRANQWMRDRAKLYEVFEMPTTSGRISSDDRKRKAETRDSDEDGSLGTIATKQGYIPQKTRKSSPYNDQPSAPQRPLSQVDLEVGTQPAGVSVHCEYIEKGIQTRKRHLGDMINLKSARAMSKPTNEVVKKTPETNRSIGTSSENTTERVLELPAVEPNRECNVGSRTQSALQPTEESTVEPRAERTTMSIAESTIEPTTDLSTDPTTEPSIEPTTEPKIGPTTEPATDRSTDPTTKPSIESTHDRTHD